MSRILLTGAGGFVGRHLSTELIRRGHFVRLLYRSPIDYETSIKSESVVGDLSAAPQIDDLLLGVDTVVHAAGRAHVMNERSLDPEGEFRRANADVTVRLAHRAAAVGAQHFIYFSSIKVLGESTFGTPFDEATNPAPVDPYGRSKLAAEISLKEIGARSAMRISILRPPLVYGPGVRGNIMRLMRMVRSGIPMPFGSIRNRRSLIGIGNLCSFISHLVEAPPSLNRICHATDCQDLSTPDLIRCLASGVGRTPRLIRCPPYILRRIAKIAGAEPAMRRLTEDLVVDSQNTRRILNWEPPYSVEEEFRRISVWSN